MGLQENLQAEPISRLSLRQPVLAPSGAKVRAAIESMRAAKLGCAVVVDEDEKPIGAFSEGGVIDLLLTNPAAIDQDCVDDHLDETWATLPTTAPIAQLVRIMQEMNLRFVVVTDERGKVVALTGQKGLIEFIAEHYPDQALVQRLGCKPAMTKREGA